jgi:hypothetical protein
VGGGEGAHGDGKCAVDGVGPRVRPDGIAVLDGRGEP